MKFLFHNTRKTEITNLMEATFQFTFVASVHQSSPLKNVTISILSNGLNSLL